MTSAVRRAGLALGTALLLLGGTVAVVPPAQAAGATLRVYDATLTEGTGGQAIVAFAVQLSAKQTKAVTFTWGTAAQTAVSPADFTAVPTGTKASIAAGSTSTVLIVKVAADSVDEYTETFGVHVSGASSGITIADADATATILDDDAPPVLSLSPLPIVEGTDAAPLDRVVTASLSQVSGKPVSVRYAVSPGTALIGSDLVGGTGTVVFDPGQLTADLSVGIVGDDVDEPNESFSLTWAAPTNLQLPARSSLRSLVDDDGPLRPSILGSTPLSPSPVVDPVLFGVAPALSTVEVFDNGTCAGTPIASGPADVFTGAGFAVPVTPNTTNTLTVMGTNTVGGVDTQCSSPFTYRHDDIAPAAPTVIAVPGTPTQDPAPTVRGSAENGSTVDVYVDTDCSGTPVSTGTSADYGDADGLPLGTLTANTPHAVRVSATDAAGNVSACSPPLTVTIDTVGPAAPTGLAVLPAAVTSDTTPALRGDAEAGSTVQVFVDEPCDTTPHDTGTAADFADTSGITLTPALAEGDHELRARAVDVAGNEGTCSGPVTVSIDTTAPAAPTGLALLTGTPTSDGSVRVSGSAEAGSTVTVYRDTGGGGVSCDTVVATGSAASFGDANGLTASPALGDGTYVLRATATDSLGQESPCSTDSVTVVVDLTAPPAPANLSVVQGALTNDPTPALAGDAQAGTTVEVWVDAVCTGTADASGAAGQFGSAAGIAVPTQPDGPHLLYARATDGVGNPSSCAGPASVTVDTHGPAAPTGLSVLPAALTSDPTPALVGTTAEAGSTIEVFVDDPCTGTVRGSGTRAEFLSTGITVAPGLPEGPHQLFAHAVDAAGNDGTCSAGEPVTVDVTPPAAPTALAVAGLSPTNQTTVGISGSVEGGTTVTIYRGPGCGTVVGSGTAVEFNSQQGIDVTLAEGTWTLRAVATDTVGLDSGCSASSVDVEVDLTAPDAPTNLAVLPASPTNDPTPALTGSAEGGSQVHVWVDHPACNGPADATGTAAVFGGVNGVVLASLPEGSHSLTATATDAAGNESACSAVEPVVIDLTAPAAPVLDAIADTQDLNQRASGTAEVGSTVRVFTNGTCTPPMVSSGPSATFAAPGLGLGLLEPGPVTVTARAVDDAGNVGPCSDPVTFAVLP